METLDNMKFVVDKLRSTNREGMEDLLNYMTECGFFDAPCSGGNHLCCQYGLVHQERDDKSGRYRLRITWEKRI